MMKGGLDLKTQPFNSTVVFPFYTTEQDFLETLSAWASPKDDLHLTLENFVLTAVYSAIFLAGVTGNFLTAYVVLKQPHMKTITNRLIFNLALSDSFFMLCLPFVIVTSIERNWVFGEMMCKAFYAINCVNIFAGSFTLAILSADRYIAVCHSVYAVGHRSPARVTIAIVISWLLSCLATLPVIWYAVVVDRESVDVLDEEYDDDNVELLSYPYVSDKYSNNSYHFFDGYPYGGGVLSYPFNEYSHASSEEEEFFRPIRNSTFLHLKTLRSSNPIGYIPTFFNFNLESDSWFNQTDLDFSSKYKSLTCSVDFPTHGAYPLKFAYVIYSTIVGFIIPVIAIIVFYSLLVMRLASTASKVNQRQVDEVIIEKREKPVSDSKDRSRLNDPPCQELTAEQRKAQFSFKSISSPDIPTAMLALHFQMRKDTVNPDEIRFHGDLPSIHRNSSRMIGSHMGCRFEKHSDEANRRGVSSKSNEDMSDLKLPPDFLHLKNLLSKMEARKIISVWHPQKLEKHVKNLERRKIDGSIGGGCLGVIGCGSRTPTNNPTVSSADKASSCPGGHNHETNTLGPHSSSKEDRQLRYLKRKRKKFATANASRRHRKVTRLVTAVIVVYVACWLPYYAFQLRLLVDPRTVAKNPWTMYLYYIVTTLTYLNSVLNPVLYALTNKNFQDAFKDTFSCCVRVGGSYRNPVQANKD